MRQNYYGATAFCHPLGSVACEESDSLDCSKALRDTSFIPEVSEGSQVCPLLIRFKKAKFPLPFPSKGVAEMAIHPSMLVKIVRVHASPLIVTVLARCRWSIRDSARRNLWASRVRTSFRLPQNVARTWHGQQPIPTRFAFPGPLAEGIVEGSIQHMLTVLSE